MKKEMLINVLQPEESRIAVLEDGQIEELYVERSASDNFVGNIYKGKVVNIEPSIQAAFVDFGVGKNGFLHVSDVEYQYFKHLENDSDGRRRRGRRVNERSVRNKPPIQDIFQRGSEVLVQVIKEGLGNKGPTLSTYISIPGRYLVLMPALGRVGVSRKIEDDEVRRELRQTLVDLEPPEGLGFIIRTAGVGRSRKDLRRDLNYLLRLWRVIVRRLKKQSAPIDIYEESDMIIRTIRDVFNSEIDTIWIDSPEAYDRAREFMKIVMPKQVRRVELYEGKEPLFHKYKIEDEIGMIQQREVALPGGGSIVIDQTEALVAIDVNSGNYRAEENNAEQTAYEVNMRAAKEISRQLRLRDLGGVIVNDFIDMRDDRHRRRVEHTFRELLKRDRARTKMLRISPFGLIEMTRQRIRPSLKRSVYQDCPCCKGTGHVKTAESMSIEVMRMIMSASHQNGVTDVIVEVHQDVENHLSNRKRKELAEIEDEGGVQITINGRPDVFPEHLAIRTLDEMGAELRLPGVGDSQSPPSSGKLPRSRSRRNRYEDRD